MASYINLTVIGNLGQDAEAKATPDGKYFVSFSVAAKKRGKEETQWFDVTAWGRLAETMMNLMQNNGALGKGDSVFIEGPIELNQYQKNDGTGGASIRLTADNITLLGSRNDNQSQNQGYAQQQAPQQYQQPQQQYQQQYQQAPQQQYQQPAPPPPPHQGGYR